MAARSSLRLLAHSQSCCRSRWLDLELLAWGASLAADALARRILDVPSAREEF